MGKDNIQKNIDTGATVVITHRVNEEKQAQYEAWLNEIGPRCRSTEGLLDLHVIRPVQKLSDTYSIIIRYDTEQNLKNWIESEDRKRLISKVQNLLIGNDSYLIKSGLDFWFAPEGTKSKIPVRWKQFVLTWSAIYPLVTILPLALIPLLRWLNLPEQHYLDMLILTGIVVFMMVYIVMPRYTKLVRNWLFQ
jgi:antibiotic biosynthesis monooxygenase (ABM) superfamily enzyme